MNYASKFDGKLFIDGVGTHANGHAPGDSVSPHTTHAPADAIIVPDAHLLFNGDFKRSGVDLILSADDQKLVLHDYFKGEKRAALASPDGAHLTGDIVKALAGHVEYAQADGSASVNKIIGHVTKLAGTATAIRNGVSIILNQGDNVEKGDVVQSGSGSTVGITFIDGTVFGLSSNARMVLNEMVYDPNGSNNSSLLSLVAGTITFVAGETAKHGDMKIDTPVATMGIRGTAVLVEIDFDTAGQNGLPDTKFQVLVEPDGTTGSYILFDKVTLTPFAIVDKAGTQFNFSNGNFSQSLTGLTPEVQKLITDVFAQRFSDNTNTKTFDHHTDFGIPDTLPPIKVGNTTITQFVVQVNTLPTTSTPTPTGPGQQIQHIAGPPGGVIVNANGQASTDFKITEIPGVTGSATPDKISGQVNFVDINAGDQPTVSAKFDGSTYTDPHGNALSLNSQQLADIKAVEVDLAVTATPGNNNNGSASWSYTVPDGSFDFLAAGETLQLTYTLTVDNNYAPDDEKTPLKFTITITGTNDVPVITTAAQTIHFAGGKGTTGGDLAPTSETSGVNVSHPTTLSYSEKGTLSFTDPDLTDTHTIVATGIVVPGQTGDLTGASLAGVPLDLATFQQQFPLPFQIFENALSASIGTDSTGTGTGTINWTFAELPAYVADFIPSGETLTLTYTVEVKDSQGAISTQTITVTVTGNDTPAVVWIDTKPAPSSGALWSDGSNWETGNAPTIHDDAIIITDQLRPSAPTYPVVINAAASAKSLLMDDPAGLKAPELDNENTLTIAGGLMLSADAILKNLGGLATILSIGGLAEILNNSVLNNSGTIKLAQGGAFHDQSSITNSGVIEVVSDTLDVQVNIANSASSGGTLQVDNGATLKLSTVTAATTTITNGNLTLGSGSTLDIESIVGATLDGVTVTGTNASTGPTVAASTIEIGAAGASMLKLDDGTTIKNGILTIAGGSTLDIESSTGATLDGVSVTGSGTTGPTASLIEIGATTASGSILTLDDGTTIKNGALTIAGGSKLDVESTGGATLDGVNVTGTGTTGPSASLIEIGTSTTSGSILTLDDATIIKNGTVTIAGGSKLDVESTGGATLDGANVTGTGTTGPSASLIEIGASTTSGSILTLDDATIIKNGTVTIAGGSKLDVESTGGATLDGVSVTGTGTTGPSASLIEIGATTTSGSILTLDDGTTIKNGALTIAGGSQLDVESTGGATLDGVDVTGTGTTGPSASLIEIGAATTSGSILTLNDGTTIKNGALTIAGSSQLDVESTGGATLDGVNVTGTGTTGPSASLIEIGASTTSGSILTLDDATIIKNGALTIAGGSKLDVESTGGATLDGVNVTGTTGPSASLIEIGATTTSGSILTLDDGTTIKNGALTIAGSSKLDVESTGGATLDGVNVTGTGTTGPSASLIEIGASTTSGSILTLDDGTIIKDGALTIATGGALDIEGIGGATLDGVTVSGGGAINVDGAIGGPIPATLTLEGGTTITGGTLTNGSVGTLDVESASGATLDDVTIIGGGAIEVSKTTSGAILTLTDGTTVTDGTLDITTGGEVYIQNGNGTFGATLDHVAITGGGEIEIGNSNNPPVSPGSTLILADGTTISGVMLTLDDTTDVVDIEAGTHGDGVTFGNMHVSSLGTLSISDGATLTLNDASIDGGTINDGTAGGTGHIDVTGLSAITNAILSNGDATIATGTTLTLDGDTVNGTTISGTDLTSIIQVGASSGSILTLDDGASIVNGELTIAGGSTLDVESTGGATLDGVDVIGTGTTGPSASLIEIGASTTSGSILALDDRTIIKNGTLTIAGGSTLDVEGTGGATLDGVNVTGTGTTGPSASLIEIGASTTSGSILTLDEGTIIKNGALTIAGGSTLDVESTGGATLDGVAVTGVNGASGSTIEVGTTTTSGTVLTLDDGTSITNGNLTIDAGNGINVTSTGGATLDGVAVTGVNGASGSTIEVGTTTTTGTVLTLDDGTSITNGNLIIDAGNGINVTKSGATLDGVSVAGTSGVSGSTIEVGTTTTTGTVLTLDDGTSITNGNLTIDAGNALDVTKSGATLDGVSVAGTSGVSGSTIEVGTTTTTGTVLTLDDGTSITNGNLTIDAGNALDVTKSGATLDGVSVTGVNGASGSTIEVGTTTTSGTVLTLDDGTSITNGNLTIDAGNALDVTKSGATLDGVSVTGVNGASGSTIEVGTTTTSGTVLTLDDGTTVTDGNVTIDAGNALDVTKSGATLDGVSVTGVNGASGSTIEVGTTTTSGTVLTLDDDTTITDGNVTIDAGNGINVTSTGGATLDGVAVTGVNGASGSTIEVGTTTTSGTVLTLDDGTSITNGNLTIDAGNALDVTKSGATLDGVSVTGVNGASGSTIEVGTTTTTGTVLTLDDGTSITNGNLTIDAGNALDVTKSGATLDGVSVTGVNGASGSTIEVGTTTTSGTVLTLDDGTSITNGNLTIDAGNALDVEAVAAGGIAATLDGVTVTGTNGTTASGIDVGTAVLVGSPTANLVLDDGTKIINGNLTIGSNGILEIEVGSGGTTANPDATLDGVTVTNSGEIYVDLNALGAILTLDDGTKISGGKLGIATGNAVVDVELGSNGGNGATFDDVHVNNSGTIEVGVTSVATLVLVDGTNVLNGNLNIASGSTVDVTGGTTHGGVTLDGVTVTGTNAAGLVAASKIEVGTTTTAGTVLTLNNGTTITNGSLAIDSGNMLEIFAGSAALLGVSVTGVNAVTGPAPVTASMFQIDDGNTLTISGTTINLGIINDGTADGDGGTVFGHIEVTGTSTISNATLNNGSVKVEAGVTLTLTGDTVNGTSIEVDPAGGGAGQAPPPPAPGTLVLQGGTTLNNSNLTIDSIDKVKLNGATISGGTITNNHTIDVTANSIINGNAKLNSGGVTIESGVILTLDNVTVTGASFNDSGAEITIDSTTTLGLSGVTINGGGIIDNGTLNVIDTATLAGVTFSGTTGGTGLIENDGTLTLGTGGITLADSNYTLELDGSGTLQMNGQTIKMGTVTGDTLINNGNTISGTGQIGSGRDGTTPLIVDNVSGTIEAIGGILQISTGAAFTNSGLLEAASDGTLDITIGTIHNDGTNPLATSDAGGILLHGILEVDNPTTSAAMGTLTLNGTGNGAVVLVGGTIEGNSTNAETLVNQNNVISGYGTIGLGTDFLTLQNKANGVIDANVSGQTLTIDTVSTANSGLIEATNGGTLQIETGVTNTGVGAAIKADGGTVVIGANASVTGTVPVTITDGGLAEFVGSTTQALNLNAKFVGAGTLQLDNAQHYSGTISSFGAGDKIDLVDLAYSSTETDVWDSVNNTLTITSGIQTEVLKLAGSFTQNDFVITNGGHGHTELVSNAGVSQPQVTMAGLDSFGNAVAGDSVTAGFSSPGNGNTGSVTYTWLEGGQVVQTGASDVFATGTGDVGKVLDVVVGFDFGNEQITAVAGTVAAPPAVNFNFTGGATTNFNTPLTLNSLNLTFVDAGSDSFTVTLHADHGTLSLTNAGTLTEGGTGGTLTLTGTLADIDTALGHGLVYTPTAGYAGSDTLSVSAQDGNFSSGATALNINVLPAQVLNFTTLDVPSATATYAFGINNAGEIVGQTSVPGHELGWSYLNGTFQSTQDSSAHNTSFDGINNFGVVAGYDEPNSSTPRYGFTLTGSTFSTIDLSPNVSTVANGINDAGVVVGSSYLHTISGVTPVYTGYVDSQGTVTYLNAPGTLTADGYTAANGINDTGQIVGDFETTYGSNNHGFLYQHGVFTTIDDPNAGSQGTSAQGINKDGVIVGFYTDASNKQHGFIDNGGIFTTVDDPLGVNGTALEGVNDAGVAVGYYIDANHVAHGFVVSPTVTITVLTTNGLDFQHHNALVEMGSGVVQPGGSLSSFTIIDTHDNLRFVVDGNNLTYGSDGTTVTGGTINSFHEFTNDTTPVALADFTGLSVDAPMWMSAVQQAAGGDQSAIKALTSEFSYNFVGGSGPDTFGSAGLADTLSGTGADFFDGGGAPAGSHDTETGGAGSTFVFAQGYGALTITNFDRDSNGNFSQSIGDHIQLNGFSGNPTVTYVNGNTVADFGNGDVLTLLHVNPANLVDSDFIGGGNGGNNANGPVISNANNTVTYAGTPVTLDAFITVADTAATVSTVNAWISSGEQAGDQLTINGNVTGTIVEADGSIISYNFDSTLNTVSHNGHGFFLQNAINSPHAATTADFQAALQQIQFSPGATDGDRTVTWAANDGANFSSTETTTVHVGPILNSFTLTISEGGTTVLSDANFDVTHAHSTDFFSLQAGSVKGGEFEVTQDGGITWPSAPTGGFTIAQIEAGDVRFVQDGSATVPDFSITVSDGQSVSPAFAPNMVLEIAGADSQLVTFAGSSGTLLLDNPSGFTGTIAGISGTGDVLDLGSFGATNDTIVASTAGSYHSNTNTTSLVVTDETTHASVTLSLAGDYSGSSWATSNAANGGTQIVDTTASLAIASGATVELSGPGAPGEGVTFQGSTGTLIIDQPSSFTGVISGFSGAGTPATSDQIDLKGIDHNSGSFSDTYDAATDTLFVTDGTHSATLHLNGIYQQANFIAESDNNGGTIIYDPPATSNGPHMAVVPATVTDAQPAASTIAPTAPNQTLTGNAVSDTFVFNFATVGQATVTNFHTATDTLQFNSQLFANVQAALNATQDDGHGNTVITLDAHDSITLSGVVKAQLHANDFHFA